MRSPRSVLVAFAIGLVALVAVAPAQSHLAAGHSSTPGRAVQASLAAASVIELQITGTGQVPGAGVGAVALNVAVTNPSAASFLSVYPSGSERPPTATLAFGAQRTVSTMAIVQPGSDGKVTIYNHAGTVDVVIDVQGWFPANTAYQAVMPARLMDTRPGFATVDGVAAGEGPVDDLATLPVLGRGGVPADLRVSMVALSVTVTHPTASSYLTVYRGGGGEVPNAANLNFVRGETVTNMVVAFLGSNGGLNIANYAGTTDVIVDLVGYVMGTDGGFETDLLHGVSPSRLLDTRAGYATVDGLQAGAGRVDPDDSLTVQATNRQSGSLLPATGVGSVIVNVTAVSPTDDTYLTVYPTGEPLPTAANLNPRGGETRPNLAIAKIGSDGTFTIYNYAGRTDITVDLLGWIPGDSGYVGLTPQRLLDTRAS